MGGHETAEKLDAPPLVPCRKSARQSPEDSAIHFPNPYTVQAAERRPAKLNAPVNSQELAGVVVERVGVHRADQT